MTCKVRIDSDMLQEVKEFKYSYSVVCKFGTVKGVIKGEWIFVEICEREKCDNECRNRTEGQHISDNPALQV